MYYLVVNFKLPLEATEALDVVSTKSLCISCKYTKYSEFWTVKATASTKHYYSVLEFLEKVEPYWFDQQGKFVDDDEGTIIRKW